MNMKKSQLMNLLMRQIQKIRKELSMLVNNNNVKSEKKSCKSLMTSL
ncbi:hypothetical protein X975_22883, partial [Stegodyphus mimosarum]